MCAFYDILNTHSFLLKEKNALFVKFDEVLKFEHQGLVGVGEWSFVFVLYSCFFLLIEFVVLLNDRVVLN